MPSKEEEDDGLVTLNLAVRQQRLSSVLIGRQQIDVAARPRGGQTNSGGHQH